MTFRFEISILVRFEVFIIKYEQHTKIESDREEHRSIRQKRKEVSKDRIANLIVRYNADNV